MKKWRREAKKGQGKKMRNEADAARMPKSIHMLGPKWAWLLSKIGIKVEAA